MKQKLYFYICVADLVSATNTTNVNIPQMADTLFERSTNASWVVVFKALVTTHHICVHGNEVSACSMKPACLEHSNPTKQDEKY